MPTLKTYDLFISHAWKYNQSYYNLVDLLKGTNYFKWRNYSVPEHDPVIDPNTESGRNTLIRELREQIRPVNCVLIIAGMYANHKYWIQKEIDIARKQYRKPMIGIRPWGAARIPSAVTEAVDEMVYWQASSIVDAIRRHSI